jgi:hypothetical protein
MTEAAQALDKKHGSETRQKGAFLAFRVTPEERAEVEAAAEAAGLTVSSFIRVKILKKIATGQKRKPRPDRVLLGQILGQLGKVGGNLNQIAKRLNEGKGVGAERITSATDEFLQLRDELLKAIKGLENDYQGQIQSGSEPACGLPSQAREK